MSKPWLKSWVCSLDKPKVMALPGDLFKAWQVLQWVAARDGQDGELPDLEQCAFMMRKDAGTIEPYIKELIKRGLIDETPTGLVMHDWEEWQGSQPSETPEAWRERKRKERSRKASRDVTEVTSGHRDVTDVTDVTPKMRVEETKAEKDEIKVEVPRDARDTQTKRKRPATPIPDPFTVTKAMNDWADGHGYTRAFLEDATEYFCDWATSHDHRYADWPSVWRRVVKSRWDEQHRNVVQMRRA